jgi:acetolactate synthase-1/2/3 large subunit
LLVNPDFAALARACGANGETVQRTEEFEPAFKRALERDSATLLHVRLDPQALTMNQSLDAIRSAAAPG